MTPASSINKIGRTGFSAAVQHKNNAHVLRYLVSTFATPTKKEGHTGHVADEIAALTKETKFGLIADATRSNSHDCLRFLLFEMASCSDGAATVDYLFRSRHGWSVLHHAGANGDAETMAILAQHGLPGVDPAWTGTEEKVKVNWQTAEDLFALRLGREGLEEPWERLLRVVRGGSWGTTAGDEQEKDGISGGFWEKDLEKGVQVMV